MHAQESDREEPLLAQREGSFQSAQTGDSFTSARSRDASHTGGAASRSLACNMMPHHMFRFDSP